MTTNIWGCDYRMCVSERAFGDYLMQDERRKLIQAYKSAGMKRFHYTNSATLEYTHTTCFISYYTWILDYYEIDGTTKDVYMHVSPFVFLKDEYINSPTTSRQANRWLKESGFEFTIQDIARAYKNAVNGVASHPLTRVVDGMTTYVLPRFNAYQTYLNEDGTYRHQKAIDKMPYLAYDERQSTLVRTGWAINDGNTFGVRYD